MPYVPASSCSSACSAWRRLARAFAATEISCSRSAVLAPASAWSSPEPSPEARNRSSSSSSASLSSTRCCSISSRRTPRTSPISSTLHGLSSSLTRRRSAILLALALVVLPAAFFVARSPAVELVVTAALLVRVAGALAADFALAAPARVVVEVVFFVAGAFVAAVAFFVAVSAGAVFFVADVDFPVAVVAFFVAVVAFFTGKAFLATAAFVADVAFFAGATLVAGAVFVVVLFAGVACFAGAAFVVGVVLLAVDAFFTGAAFVADVVLAGDRWAAAVAAAVFFAAIRPSVVHAVDADKWG